ncbi:MAG: ASCH domain-containing protein [Myxococcales bacterium]|nr:ASCH domain-containing protein [Myxococcales bacterium]
MSELPEKTCTLDTLITHPRLVQAVLEGRKTHQRRNGVYGYPGERFELDGITFEITALERQRLGDLSEDDAIAEGMPNLDAYKGLIQRMHPNMPWNPNMKVWLHAFRRVE